MDNSAVIYSALAAGGLVLFRKIQANQGKAENAKQRQEKNEIDKARKEASETVEDSLNPTASKAKKTQMVKAVEQAAEQQARKYQRFSRPMFAVDGQPVQKRIHLGHDNFVKSFYQSWVPIHKDDQNKTTTLTDDMTKIIDPAGYAKVRYKKRNQYVVKKFHPGYSVSA